MDWEDKDEGGEWCNGDFAAVVIGHRRGIEPRQWTGKTRTARGTVEDKGREERKGKGAGRRNVGGRGRGGGREEEGW
ncbi:hypothetical protein Droror1_Dr00000961 [Drosera rotundifolia]